MQIAFEQCSEKTNRPKLRLTRLAALACAFLLCNGSAGICQTNEEAQIRKRAYKLIETGHSDIAFETLLQFHRKHPTDTRFLVDLGEAYLHDDTAMVDYQMKAEQCFRKAIKLDPEFGRAYRLLAEWANGQCKYDIAFQMSSQALAVKKPDMQAYMERAKSFRNQHKDKEAVADLDKLIATGSAPGKIQPGTLRKAYELRAALLENLRLYERALADYRYLQKERFYDPTALREASCLEKLNRNDEAMVCLNGLLKTNPEDETALETRGRIWAKQGRYKEAISDYSKSIQLIPSAALYKQRAEVYEKMGRKDLAARDRKEAEHF